MAVTSVLLAGAVQLPAMAANTYTSPLNLTTSDNAFLLEEGDTVTGSIDAPYNLVYDLQDGTSIAGVAGCIDSMFVNTTATINIGGGTGTMYMMSANPEVMAFEGTALIALADSDNLTINGNLQGMVDNGGYSAQGISAFPKGSGSGSPVHLVVNGNIDFWGASDNPELDQPGAEAGWGIQAEKTNGAYDFYHGSRWAPAGVQLSMSGGSTADLNGDVRISVRGNGLVAAGTYAVAGMDDYDLAVINANKGDVTIYTPKSTERGYNALAGFGGTINVNWENGAPGDHNVVLKGNIIALKVWSPGTEGADSGEPYYYRSSKVNLGLTTDKSSWSGLVSNDGKLGAGEVNIGLQNGAKWDHVAYSLGETMSTETMPVPSNNGHYGKYTPTSFVNQLRGGADEAKAGLIFQNDVAGIDIKEYSGFTKAFYAHDEAAPATIKGGSITIGKAAAGSGITLVTDNAGIDMTDGSVVDSTLTALANKLYYTGYKDGERNLAGKVEIAEGLTSASASLDTRHIDYNAEGQGTLGGKVVPGGEEGGGHGGDQGGDKPAEPEADFTDVPITGDTAEDADPSQAPFVKAGILKDGVYRFNGNTTLTAKEHANVVDAREDVKIDAAGHILTMKQNGHEGGVNLINGAAGKKIEVNAGRLVVDARADGRTEAIHLFSRDENAKSELVVNGDLDVSSINSKAEAIGIYAAGNAAVTVNGNLKMNNGKEWAVDSHEGGFEYYGASGIYATSNMGPDGMGSQVTLNGGLDMKVNSNGLYTNAGGSIIDAKGDVSVEVNKDNTKGYAALRAEDGVVNVNVVKDGSGKVIGAGDRKVDIKGNVAVTTGAVNSVDKKGTLSAVNLGLSTDDSSLHGVIYNAFKDEGKESNGVVFTGETNLVLENGATWTNEKYGPTGGSWGGEAFAGSKVTGFTGGSDAASAGLILQKDENPITMNRYGGFVRVAYEHDKANPADIKGGDIHIGKAAAGSGITLMTDNTGLNTASKKAEDKKLVTDTLTALAGKLHYAAHADGEKNLEGQVQIAEGLTASSVALAAHEIDYKADGQGTLGDKIELGSLIEYGSKETAMMKGAKSAMASTALMWRNTGSDLHQRLGDLRLAKEERGVWAKYKGGKLSMDSQNTNLSNRYKAFSAGYDLPVGGDWTVGGAVTKLDGDTTFTEGTSDNKEVALTAYGTMLKENGQYLDLVMSRSRLKTDFHVANLMGHQVDGDYKTRGNMFSAEYGKRFTKDNGFYVDPSVQFTVGKIKGQSYSAASDFSDGAGGFKSMYIEQEGFTSAVGRLGISMGKQADNYNAFAKLVLAHEFSGGFDSIFSADGEAQNSKTHLDLKDTWCEFEIGGSAKVTGNTYLYGTFARSFAGDVTSKWRVDAGARFSF